MTDTALIAQLNTQVLAVQKQLADLQAKLAAALAPAVADGSHILCPLTGHVLPAPDLAKGWPQYVLEVGQQFGMAGKAGGVYVGDNARYFPTGFDPNDAARWAIAADRFYWPRAYMTPEELAEDDRRMAIWANS